MKGGIAYGEKYVVPVKTFIVCNTSVQPTSESYATDQFSRDRMHFNFLVHLTYKSCSSNLQKL